MKVVRMPKKNSRKGVILCADRDLSNLDLYERVLGEKGYTVRTCTTGLDAIAEIDTNPVDLVLLGLRLAEGANASVCKMIKQRSENNLPVIVVGEPHDEDLILSSLNDGADDYMVKPVKINELVTKVSITIAKISSQATPEPSQLESSINAEPEPPVNHLASVAETQPTQESPLPKIKMLHITKEAQTSEIEEQPPPLAERPPSELFAGSYELGEKIGKGSYSVVYRAVDRHNTPPVDVAIKIFELESYKEVESSTQSFLLREAYEMSKLDHPNIVKMLDFGKFKNSYYMVMELVPGESLAHVIETMGCLGEDNLVYIAFQASSVLIYLEKNNVVHRDIKPENILINEEGDIKFTDFGLAKQCADNFLTRKNQQFMGTPQYVAPEQIVPAQKVDIRCDVYALGATLYYCGTKRFPFTGKNVVEILINNLNVQPTPMHEINPDISVNFSKIIAKMMEKKKEQRFTPTELKEQLKDLLSGQ